MVTSIKAPNRESVNWPAVRAWAEIHYPDAGDTFETHRRYYLAQFIRSQRSDAYDLSNMREAGVA